jgi:hypothetical protein
MPRTVKLYRIESDGRRLAAGAIRASSQDDLVAHWQLFLATARARSLRRQLSWRAARHRARYRCW